MILKPALSAIALDQSKNLGALDVAHRFPKFVPYGFMYSADGWTVESDFTKVNGKFYLAFFHAEDAVPTVLNHQITSNPWDEDCLTSGGTYWLLTAGKLVKATYKDVGLHLADIAGLSSAITGLPTDASYWFSLDGNADKAMLYMKYMPLPSYENWGDPLRQLLRKDMDLTGDIGTTVIRNAATFVPTPPPGLTFTGPVYGEPYVPFAFYYGCYPPDLTVPAHIVLKELGGDSLDVGTTLEFFGSNTSGAGDLPSWATPPWNRDLEFWVEVDGVESNHVCWNYGTGEYDPTYGEITAVPVLYTGTVRCITPLAVSVSESKMIVAEHRSDVVNFSIEGFTFYDTDYGAGTIQSLGDTKYFEVDVADLISNPVTIDAAPSHNVLLYADYYNGCFAVTPQSGGGAPILYHKKGDGTWEKITITVPTGYTAIWPLSYQYGWSWLYQLESGDPSLIFAVYKTDGTDAVQGTQFYRLATMTIPSGTVTIDPTTYKVRESEYKEVGGVWGYYGTEPPVYHDVGPMTGKTVVISKDGKHGWYSGIYCDNTFYANLDDYTVCRTVVLAKASNSVWFQEG
jgi:hypothetical protein